MRTFRSILTDLALLPITGCIFPGHRDTADDVAPPRPRATKGHPTGVGRDKFPVAGSFEVRKGWAGWQHSRLWNLYSWFWPCASWASPGVRRSTGSEVNRRAAWIMGNIQAIWNMGIRCRS